MGLAARCCQPETNKEGNKPMTNTFEKTAASKGYEKIGLAHIFIFVLAASQVADIVSHLLS